MLLYSSVPLFAEALKDLYRLCILSAKIQRIVGISSQPCAIFSSPLVRLLIIRLSPPI